MKRIILLLTFVGFLGQSIYSQTTFKERMNNYGDICFCTTGLSNPRQLLDLDNNLEIIFALKSGRKLSELDKLGIKYNRSQISLLKFSGMINRKDSVYYSLVPILSEIETMQLRHETQRMAADIIPLFQKDFDTFMKTLESRGLQNNSYSLMFGYILDGLVWDILWKSNVLENFKTTEEKPFWDGTYWMIKPERDFRCGTNSYNSGKLEIRVNWSDCYERSIAINSSSKSKLLIELLEDFNENGKVTKSSVLQEFCKNALIDKNGGLNIPVITEDSTDIIYLQSKNIAQKVVGYINNIDYSAILPDYENLTKSQKLIICYHEIMWDILKIMEEDGQIHKPFAFSNPQQAKDGDMKDLICIVKR